MRWKAKRHYSSDEEDWGSWHEWHAFFFLWPRRVDGYWVWLEWGERRCYLVDRDGSPWFEYRLKENTNELA